MRGALLSFAFAFPLSQHHLDNSHKGLAHKIHRSHALKNPVSIFSRLSKTYHNSVTEKYILISLPPTSTVSPPPSNIFFSFSFSSRNSRISLSIGFSLTTALFLIFFARSAYLLTTKLQLETNQDFYPLYCRYWCLVNFNCQIQSCYQTLFEGVENFISNANLLAREHKLRKIFEICLQHLKL